METELRKTGISMVDTVPWGTHFCTFYETTQDLLDILVPFFKVGLESKEFCLWIISNSELLTKQQAMSALEQALPDVDRHLSDGSIELVEHDQWFLEEATFDLYRVAHRFKEKLDAALAKGYVGMRVNGSPAWLYEENQKELIAFEKQADKLFHDLRLIASCTYSISGSTADELLDVARTHQFVLMIRHGEWAVLETPELMQARAEVKKLNEELEVATRVTRAQDDERRRIAQMLHETTAQDLAALKMLLARLRHTSVALSDADRILLAESIDLTDRSMGDVRTLSYLLHPPFLDENGLLSALRWYAKGFADRSEIAVDLDVPPVLERLPQDVETILFRVVQEALTNIHRHARSMTARIRLRAEGGRLTLEVEDRGRGMSADVLSNVTSGGGAPGVGIAGLRQRLQQLGGTLHLESNDRGTTIRAMIPLHAHLS